MCQNQDHQIDMPNIVKIRNQSESSSAQNLRDSTTPNLENEQLSEDKKDGKQAIVTYLDQRIVVSNAQLFEIEKSNAYSSRNTRIQRKKGEREQETAQFGQKTTMIPKTVFESNLKQSTTSQDITEEIKTPDQAVRVESKVADLEVGAKRLKSQEASESDLQMELQS